MKKEDFLAEVARIYFRANSYEELFPYLALGYCSDVIDAQLNAIRSITPLEIQALAQEYLRKEDLIEIIAGKKSAGNI